MTYSGPSFWLENCSWKFLFWFENIPRGIPTEIPDPEIRDPEIFVGISQGEDEERDPPSDMPPTRQR